MSEQATQPPTNHTGHAIRVGLGRGWTEFVLSIRSSQDQGFYLFTALCVLGYLTFNRHDEVAGTTLSYPAVAMPSILGGLIAFGAVLGPAYQLSIEREDGTLLRAKAVPNGLTGYFAGSVVLHSLGIVPSVLTILLPGLLIFDGLMNNDESGLVTVTWVLALGLLATLPIGMIIGALARSPRQVGTWGMLPILALFGISGIFYPIQEMWGWLQVVAQAFPMYWLGLGMRSAFLPDAAAALEVTGTWRTWETAGVLGAWAVVGMILAPTVLRRMARRESGSLVETRRQEFMQRIG